MLFRIILLMNDKSYANAYKNYTKQRIYSTVIPPPFRQAAQVVFLFRGEEFVLQSHQYYR